MWLGEILMHAFKKKLNKKKGEERENERKKKT
jgi:hypothetical protein